MITMRKVLALVTALAMSLSLFTGCGQKEEEAPATEAATEAADRKSVV